LIVSRLQALLSSEEALITALSNASALLYQSLPNINWCGFYLYDGKQLVLGPFGGKPACTVIPLGSGVCGTAAKERRILRVSDVDLFPGHIACDAASKSEIVIPIILSNSELFGVLDVDAPVKNRFSEEDETELGDVIDVLVAKIEAIIARTGDTRRLL
jgi:L-methionine (R)-S-oxide reductase